MGVKQLRFLAGSDIVQNLCRPYLGKKLYMLRFGDLQLCCVSYLGQLNRRNDGTIFRGGMKETLSSIALSLSLLPEEVGQTLSGALSGSSQSGAR